MNKLLVTLALLGACTDTQMSSLGAVGMPGLIVCYSGGQEIIRARSTGVIETVSSSDGWQFRDAKTRRLMRVSGDCVITY